MYKTIVVGTDGSPAADGAVATAAGLAQVWGAKLHLVTAFKAKSESSEAEMFQEAATEIGERAVSTWATGLEVKFHAVHGDAAGAILNVAEEVGADLVVMGSRGMQGARRFLGSVPNSVSHGASCAVLIVKTD